MVAPTTKQMPDALLRPDAWPAPSPRPGTVQLIETHLSWVLLGEREVFKLKKPVALGFVDFRSLERRRAACDDEVRLNARLSPRVYRGVVPVVCQSDGTLSFGGTGPVVDWAVRMARLDGARRADELLARGRLRGEDVDAIADAVARLHAGATATREQAAWASPEAVARNVRDNFTQLGGADAAAGLDREALEEVEARQTTFVTENADLFAARIVDGHVRNGHGDLRLEHAYFEDDGLQVVDCIEFDDRYRVSDACADAAFLAMDLTGHGRADLAERFLARYARAAQDYDLYALVDFYEGYRALVRAKVEAMLAGQAGADDAARRRAAESARRHLSLARATGRPAFVPPAMVCVGGVPGSGKSTIADALSEALSCPAVDADRTRKHLLGVTETTRMDDPVWTGAYSAEATERTYRETLRRAAVVLETGRSVIVDASFRAAATRRSARDVAQAAGATFRFVECRAPHDVCKDRVARRAASGDRSPDGPSDARPAIFDAFAASFESPEELSGSERTEVDTTGPLAAAVDRVRSCLPEFLHSAPPR
jgi:aminoglycoside phosphotransferase family enzyme/predicted kinase